MLPLTKKNKTVVQALLRAGSCPRCVLRFCCVGNQATYRLSSKEMFVELRKFLNDDDECKSEPIKNDQPLCKKIRLEDGKNNDMDLDKNEATKLPSDELLDPDVGVRTCTVCLGVLQDLCEKDFVKKVCDKVESAGYHFSSLVFSVSLPPQLLVREHAIWLLVKQEAGQQGSVLTKGDILQLKEVYKWITHPLLSEELGVPVDVKSLFEVSVIFAHPETDGDCHFLAIVCRDCFRPTKNKQSIFTRMAVMKALEKIKDDDFLELFHYKLEAPKGSCIVQEVQCTHNSVYVAGRYNKFSRTLPQTPWVIDGERKMESSVEELIGEPLKKMFEVDSRPFAIELLNPHRTCFLQQDIKELQQKINNSTDKIQVRDLQIVTREAIGYMKEGEEEKTKSYSALIWTEKAIERNDINFLQDIKDLKIDQKTPLRVLHRRPLAVRTRVIHNMKVEYVDQHHFRLYLKTQAGSYVKEFVHGDFGRTKPNLGTLMNTTTDILELDVESVDVDWPPKLDE
ncbi:putative tRNA pseudouridine synthase Pus10 isoform X2 [Hypanus sabinus]|uniref:putative tRNA pseudouridine synthase Pus10 isoform X2 n=1 Tax=Hypanus sabinus TaxID=79690 RepID=UPI0028C497D8|nr:putative tRNA pseudouridine synthase Pus10 isoform X2 [Hypanus sabinus]